MWWKHALAGLLLSIARSKYVAGFAALRGLRCAGLPPAKLTGQLLCAALSVGAIGLIAAVAGELTFTVQRPEQVHPSPSSGEAQLTLLAQTPELNIRVNRLTGRIKRHEHPQTHHFLYLIQGQIDLTVGAETRRIQAGDFITIPQGSKHAMQRVGTSEALFLDIAAPPDVGDVIWHE